MTQPTHEVCPESPTGQDTHHMVTRSDGRVVCAYCGKARAELAEQ